MDVPIAAWEPLIASNDHDKDPGDAEEGRKQSDIMKSTSVGRVATTMVHNKNHLVNNQDGLAHRLQISRRHLMRIFSALAETCCRNQKTLLVNVLEYVHLMAKSGMWIPMAFMTHSRYDETPLRIRAQYGMGESYVHTTKTFVFEAEWRVVMHKPMTHNFDARNCFVIQGSFAPTIRVAENGTGETIHKLLNEVNGIPWEQIKATFPPSWRVSETDQNGANLRAEAMWSASMPVRKDYHQSFAQPDFGADLKKGLSGDFLLIFLCLRPKRAPEKSARNPGYQ